ncbi:MAG: hypothetical protein BZY88_14780 [SAR202 cluster bacterium Io17-Chloro-G9]|nr:MAG: hypothetical protein BZY88_14780 [SAR202 cluster bacterium Io17-Chloro-G9]
MRYPKAQCRILRPSAAALASTLDGGVFVKSLAFLMILGLLTLLPAGVLAQQSDPPHQFFGTVLLADGSVAPDGIVVAAIVDGQMVATATVESGFQPGFYLLKVAPPRQEYHLPAGRCPLP